MRRPFLWGALVGAGAVVAVLEAITRGWEPREAPESCTATVTVLGADCVNLKLDRVGFPLAPGNEVTLTRSKWS